MYAGDTELATALQRAKTLHLDTPPMQTTSDSMAPSTNGMAANAAAAPRPGAFVVLARRAAEFLAQPNGPQAAVLEIGGWDTHANQANANGLRQLDVGLAALRSGLAASGTWARTVVVVASEFGREVAVNGTLGTDHGTGGVAPAATSFGRCGCCAAEALLQAFGAVLIAESPVEGTERYVPSLSRDLQDQAIRKAERRPGPEALQRRHHDITVLKGQLGMRAQHFDRRRDLRRLALVDRLEHPRRFGEDEVGNPCAGSDERLRRRELAWIVANQQSKQDVRVNRAHVVGACACGWPP